MIRMLCVLCSICFYGMALSQEKTVVALHLKTEPDKTEDGWYIAIERIPDINITPGQTFIIKAIFEDGQKDTSTKAVGIVESITTQYINAKIPADKFYSTFSSTAMAYFLTPKNTLRKDIFYKFARMQIGFKSVEDSVIFNPTAHLSIFTKEIEENILTAMLNDIHYTASAMIDQSDGQQQTINGGDFDGKPLFETMQIVTSADLKNFLNYVWARPEIYTGQNWKISEIFATWMVNQTPKILGETAE